MKPGSNNQSTGVCMENPSVSSFLRDFPISNLHVWLTIAIHHGIFMVQLSHDSHTPIPSQKKPVG